ncbi:MAG: molybdopterin-dependent oxidoreductase [Coriobacteriaceae bacterium]|jgi:DMSO/TMAO reductase YedYZ molybdopterin-dependent catalytic subunit|nr:molybdopterin-dependent oxidoreductase [Coriobacteriaceae bacterium]
MLKELGKIGLVAAAGSTLLVGTAQTASYALPHEGNDQATLAQKDATATEGSTSVNTLSRVEGSFVFNQTSLSSLEELNRALNNAAKHLCGSGFLTDQAAGARSAADWQISVSGAVDSQFNATLNELSKEGKARITMGCSCAGNPAGGLGTANVEVSGVTLTSIMRKAGVSDEANTIVFRSSDGYEVALPLSYVKQRHCMIAYAMNGEELKDSIGGSNQLWLGSTAALYFARDITSIRFESRETPPPAPGTQEAGIPYANMPGIGIMSSGVQE